MDPPTKVAKAVDVTALAASGALPLGPSVTLAHARAVALRLLVLEAAWHGGTSLAETVFTCLYLHAPARAHVMACVPAAPVADIAPPAPTAVAAATKADAAAATKAAAAAATKADAAAATKADAAAAIKADAAAATKAHAAGADALVSSGGFGPVRIVATSPVLPPAPPAPLVPPVPAAGSEGLGMRALGALAVACVKGVALTRDIVFHADLYEGLRTWEKK